MRVCSDNTTLQAFVFFSFSVRLAVSVTVALAISVRMSTSVGYSSYRLANARAYSRRLHHYSTHMCVRRKECVGGGGVGVSVRDFKKNICMYVRTYACVFWSIYTCQFVCVCERERVLRVWS
jgi:hypothetical protein